MATDATVNVSDERTELFVLVSVDRGRLDCILSHDCYYKLITNKGWLLQTYTVRVDETNH